MKMMLFNKAANQQGMTSISGHPKLQWLEQT
jgi:hypothetical protein